MGNRGSSRISQSFSAGGRFARRAALMALVLWLPLGDVARAGRGVARADDGPKSELEIRAIRATMKNNFVSPELRAMVKKLRDEFRFSGYKVEKKTDCEKEPGESCDANLIDDFEIEIRVLKRFATREGQKVRLQIRVTEDNKPKLNTTIEMGVGRTQLIGGWNLSDGDKLIVAVTAR